MTFEIVLVNYNDDQQAADLLHCLNAYATDPMGGGEPLKEDVINSLIPRLREHANVFSVMAYVDGRPAGLINCVDGFSTFNAKPLVNIHDVVVLPEFRRLGLTSKMFAEVERIARDKGCCKMTLEVLEGNLIAQNAYKKLGFSGYELDPEIGQAIFWQKPIIQ